MKPLSIPAGSAIMLGRPAQPMPRALSDAIGTMVRSIRGIHEAYLPQCYISEVVEPPAQVLVVVLNDSAGRQEILSEVEQGLTGLLPEGMHLDVLPISSSDDLIRTVRETRTHVHCAPPEKKTPWWRFW